MSNCYCGQQQQTHIVSGGLAITGEANLGFNSRPEGGLTITGTALNDIPNKFSFGYQHLIHLQESGSPYDNDGTANDAVGTLTPHRTTGGLYGGYCQEFRGDEYLTINSDSIDHSKPWSFSVWVQILSFYKQNYLFVFGANRIWLNVLNQFQFSTLFNGDEVTTWATSRTIHQNECWHQVTIVYRPAESIEVWVDGDLEKTTTITKQLPTGSTSSIGRDPIVTGKRALVRMQEVRLRYGAASPERIAYEYANGCGRDHVEVGSWESA